MKQLAASAAARFGWTYVIAMGLLMVIAAAQIVAALWKIIPSTFVQLAESEPAQPKFPHRPRPPVEPALPQRLPQESTPVAQPPGPSPAHEQTASPTPASPAQTQQAFALIEKAESAARVGDWPTVLNATIQAQEILGQDPQLQLQQAFALGRLEREQEALGILQKLLARPGLDPELRDQAVQLHEFLATTLSNMEALDIPPRAEPALVGDFPDLEGPIRDAFGLQPGALLGIVDVRDVTTDKGPALRVAIKSRPDTPIETKDVKVVVSFYQQTPDGKIQPVQTQASAEWISKPVNWGDNEPEIIDILYAQSDKNQTAQHPFYGYVVALYLREELQDTRSSPPELEQQFAPAPLLETP